MERLRRQEQDSSIMALRRMLQALPSPSKTPNEWQVAENQLFAELDAGRAVGRSRSDRFALAWPRPAWVVSGAGTIATLFIAAALITSPLGLLPRSSLEDSCILGAKGPIDITTSTTATTLQPEAFATTSVEAGQTYTVSSDGLAAIRLEEATGIVLSGGTRLHVEKGNSRTIRLRLEQGAVVAKVDRRSAGQRFEIVTANARCRVVGTVFRVEAQQEMTRLSVFKGCVEMSPAAEARAGLPVHAGQSVAMRGTQIEEKIELTESQTPLREISILKLALEDPDREQTDSWGIVELLSEPSGANVVLGTEVLGTTPMILRRPAGSTHLDLIQGNRAPIRKTITVKPNEIISWECRLDSTHSLPNTGKQVVSRPAPARARDERETPGILEHPNYIEALIQMTIGEYRKALSSLEELREQPEVRIGDLALVAEKIRECYRGIGDFERALDVHENRFRTETDPTIRAAALWQMANIRATCLGDYRNAERNLVDYISAYPDGSWYEQAHLLLADVQILAGRNEAAATTYRRFIAEFKTGIHHAAAVHSLARLLGSELGRCDEAAELYRTLLADAPSGKYAESALFHQAECLLLLGRPKEAEMAFRTYLTRYREGHWQEAAASYLSTPQAMR